MTRPLLAISITAFLLGGIFGYIKFADSVRQTAVPYEVSYAQQEYAVIVRKSFDAVGDPIFGTESLQVMFKGETVYARNDEVPSNETIEIRPLSGVENGENELFVSATQKPGGAALGVLQVEIRRDNFPISENTIASVPGLDTVSGTIVFDTSRSADHENQ